MLRGARAIQGALLRFWSLTIWARGAIPFEERHYRSLKRVWLPFSDAVAIWSGIQAIQYGSRILNRLYDTQAVDLFGLAMSVTGALAAFALVFVRAKLWWLEIIARIALVGLIVFYIATIITRSAPEAVGENNFVIGQLVYGLPFNMFRLNNLGEEWWERSALRRATRRRTRKDAR